MHLDILVVCRDDVVCEQCSWGNPARHEAVIIGADAATVESWDEII